MCEKAACTGFGIPALCDLQQVACPLCAPVSFSEKWQRLTYHPQVFVLRVSLVMQGGAWGRPWHRAGLVQGASVTILKIVIP